jgi:hypothetical protein
MNLLAPSMAYTLASPLTALKQLQIPPNATIFPYHPAEKCIHCGALKYEPNATRPLGDEHIIARGLGASIILPRASCREHERRTSGIETRLFHKMFDPLRKQLDIRGPDRKPLLKGHFDVSRTVDGQNVTIKLPISDHPTALYLSRLGPPGILTGRPRWLHGISGTWMININADLENLKKHRLKSFASPALDTVLFSQLLCKIAHAFAAAEMLTENFQPLLLEFISYIHGKTENDDRRYYFVGGEPAPEAPTPYLHELGLGLHEKEGKLYLVARIRLFAFFGAPIYYVVVGTISESKRAIVISRLASDNSRYRRP